MGFDEFNRIRVGEKFQFTFINLRAQVKIAEHELVRPSGLEPPTPTMSRWCSNQLSYGRTGDNILISNVLIRMLFFIPAFGMGAIMDGSDVGGKRFVYHPLSSVECLAEFVS